MGLVYGIYNAAPLIPFQPPQCMYGVGAFLLGPGATRMLGTGAPGIYVILYRNKKLRRSQEKVALLGARRTLGTGRSWHYDPQQDSRGVGTTVPTSKAL